MTDIHPSSNGLQPTPAARILALMTRVITLPTLSQRAGEEIRVRIRAITAQELIACTETQLSQVQRDIRDRLSQDPTQARSEEEITRAIRDETMAWLEQLPREQRQIVDQEVEDAIERMIRAAMLDPRLATSESDRSDRSDRSDKPDRSDGLPFFALVPDRVFIRDQILELSGFGGSFRGSPAAAPGPDQPDGLTVGQAPERDLGLDPL